LGALALSPSHLQNICHKDDVTALLDLAHSDRGGGRDVDLALKLNVLAVFAVFAFVGAILLGAFEYGYRRAHRSTFRQVFLHRRAQFSGVCV
jgi:hypothetical protein